MENTYLDEYGRAPIDPIISGFLDGRWVTFEERARLQKRYAWAIPNEAAILAVVAESPLVEIGAGTGYWASLVTSAGGDIVCYDKEPYKNHWCDGSAWYEVRRGGPRRVRKHGNRTLFLCWPPYADPLAYDALRAYRGRRLVYVGEVDGCTGCKRFHRALDKHWALVREVELPQFGGLHDALFIISATLAVRAPEARSPRKAVGSLGLFVLS